MDLELASSSTDLTPARLPVRPGEAVERCAREQAEILNRPDVASGQAPAWLVTLGVEDWECEKRLIDAQNSRG